MFLGFSCQSLGGCVAREHLRLMALIAEWKTSIRIACACIHVPRLAKRGAEDEFRGVLATRWPSRGLANTAMRGTW